ncbi:MAG: hypothetical protein QOI53_920, partial [Verrucomicrobiota bacterium]|nr:hypothetical protein [Verrucomicrobiota bacterium]
EFKKLQHRSAQLEAVARKIWHPAAAPDDLRLGIR